MKANAFAIFFLALLCLPFGWGRADGQTLPHGVKILSPQQNEEICDSTSLPISVAIKNNDSIPRILIARFDIHNIVTNFHVYYEIDTLFNVPAGVTIDTTFSPYITTPYILKELGSFLACASVSALDSAENGIPNWAFADSACVRIFRIRTTSLPFNDPSDGYAKTPSGDITDPYKWISLGATVVDGNSDTWDPPPPRYYREDPWGGVGPDTLYDPVIRLDHSDIYGHPYHGVEVGDTLVSFPFNLINQTKAILGFDYMRGGRHLYSTLEDTMFGPERTVVNKNGDVLRSGDSLIVEFKDTGEAACNPSLWNRIAAIDGGKDFEFQKFSIRLEQFTTPTFRYFTNTFRFRLRLKANDNAIGSAPSDDDDVWYIDNFSLQVPRNPEIEVRWGRVVTPYTKIPYSAITTLPIYFNVKNSETDVAIGFPMKIFIINSKGDTVYSQIQNVNSLREGTDSVIRAPDWNAQNIDLSANPFRIITKVSSSSYDSYTQDNETYSLFYLNCNNSPNVIQEFAFDDGSNDIPALTGVKAAGIGFQSTSGSYAMKFSVPHSDTVFGARIYFASGNLANDDIRVSLFNGDLNSCIPGSQILATNTAPRVGSFDTFQTYRFTKPIAVPAGIYWLSVSQLGFNNFTMGGDLSRGGGEMIVADDVNPKISPVYSDPYGTQWSPNDNSGDVNCAFAVETPALSGNWQPWMPAEGWWPSNAFGSGHQAIVWNPQLSPPFTRGGSYLPMMRVMVGNNQPTSAVQLSKEDQQEFKLTIEKDQIIISILSGSSGIVRIVDLLGRTIEEKSIQPNGEAVFSMQGLPRILFARARSQNEFKVFKIVH